jgi:hypothetical protein
MLHGPISNKADLPDLTMHLQGLVNRLLEEHASQQLVAMRMFRDGRPLHTCATGCGRPSIALFRAFAKNLPMTHAMRGWGSYELSKELSLGLREREIVRPHLRSGRLRVRVGVHVAYFAERARLGAAQLACLSRGGPDDVCWTDQRDRLLIRAVDALHDTSDVPEPLWGQLAAEFSEAELLDLLMLCGWYHAISFTARAIRVEPAN